MNRILGRPGRLLLPLAIAACEIMGCEKAAGLMLAVIAARLFSLCAGAALRRAATRVVSASRLTGNYYLALIMGVMGGAIGIFVMTGRHEITLEIALAGGLISLAQTASDGLYAIPDSISGNACDALIALYAAAGLMVSGGNRLLLICACGICLVAAVALSLALRRRLGFSMGIQVIKSAPMALLRAGLPAAAFFALACFSDAWIAAIFWAIFEAMEAPIRRGGNEGHWLNIGCALTAFIGSALCAALENPAIATAALPAVFFLMIFCAPMKRRSFGLLAVVTLALAAAWINGAGISAYAGWLRAALCGCLLAIIIPDIKTAYIRWGAFMKRRGRA